VPTHPIWIPDKIDMGGMVTQFLCSTGLGMMYVCITVEDLHMRDIRCSPIKGLDGCNPTIGRDGCVI